MGVVGLKQRRPFVMLDAQLLEERLLLKFRLNRPPVARWERNYLRTADTGQLALVRFRSQTFPHHPSGFTTG